ncbi:uncharacterized protein LOC142320006 [Lycorma delicatula]|uniref:uncharacterized protein LOC142320006 n=1 Tax=Lycorma delicatula TaxID=130591 RepID=UPI003F511E5B
MGKVVERLIEIRLRKEIEERQCLHPEQYGFRRGCSTISAIERVTNWALTTRSESWRVRKIPLMIMLGIKNAFGTVPWIAIIEALQNMHISDYLINHYLHLRFIEVKTLEGKAIYQVFGGVPQDPCLHLPCGTSSMTGFLD